MKLTSQFNWHGNARNVHAFQVVLFIQS